MKGAPSSTCWLNGAELPWQCHLQAQSPRVCAALLQRTLDSPDTSPPSHPHLLWKQNNSPGQGDTAELL